jgi:hypothetical protein
MEKYQIIEFQPNDRNRELNHVSKTRDESIIPGLIIN